VTVAPVFVVLAVALLVLSIVDLQQRRLPKRIVHVVAAFSIVWFALVALVDHDGSALARALLCGGAAFSAAAVLHSISPSGLGFGDVRLAGLLGLDLGWLGVAQAAFGLLAGVTLGALVGLVLVGLRVRGLQDGLPLGPFLAVATAVVLAVEM
jgi:leader peptidase (prepilin peptidase)/N-methyltransferase